MQSRNFRIDGGDFINGELLKGLLRKWEPNGLVEDIGLVNAQRDLLSADP